MVMPATTFPAAIPKRPPAGGPDFSLVLGGPLFQLLRRGRFTDDTMKLVHRRILLAVLITWAPLLALSALDGVLVGGRAIPFLNDIESHLRFLVVVPLLIAAELVVHRRMLPMIDQFRVRELVRPDQMARFEDAIDEAARLRNSALAEVMMIAFVYAVGVLVVWRQYMALHTGAWYASMSSGREQLSLPGYWLVFVSLPLFQFLLLRWYFRLFIWARFLWRVSRLDLDLDATHPDKAGGLDFLGDSLSAFVPIAAAHGVLLAGMLANRIFYAGLKLTDFQIEVAVVVVFLLVLFAGPLTVFAPTLARVKRTGLREYGALGQTYTRAFRAKWLSGEAPANEPLIGSADIQSLADLGNSFAAAEQMAIVPITRTALLLFVGAIVAPIVPLLLTMMSAEKLIGKLVGLVL
jgi:hypothetical protein